MTPSHRPRKLNPDTLKDFIESQGLTVRSNTGRSYVFNCPFCNGDKKLWIDKNTGQTICFKQKTDDCPTKGSRPTNTLASMTGLSAQEINAILYNASLMTIMQDEIDIGDLDENLYVDDTPELPENPLPGDAIPIDFPEAIEGASYILSRGVTLEQALYHNVTYSPAQRRVIFPVYHNNILCGWQGRAIDKNNYLRMNNATGNWRANSIMFEENLVNVNNPNKMVIIAEGAFSALKFGYIHHYIATMGKEISGHQIDIMVKCGISNFFLALDRDARGKLGKIRDLILERSGPESKVFVIPVPEHRDDFGDCTYEECVDAVKKSELMTGSELFIDLD